jgi:hypothetical protein
MAVTSPDIIGRAEAKALGLKHYFTGKPCKHGHVAERSVSRRECMECDRAQALDWRAANLEKAREAGREHSRKYQAAHQEKRREYQRRWRAANKDKINAQWRAARAAQELNGAGQTGS